MNKNEHSSTLSFWLQDIISQHTYHKIKKKYKNMAHKKAILEKFINETSSSDCRSPIHNGMTWLIPETSASSENEKNPQQDDQGQMSSRGNFPNDNSPLTSHHSPNQGIINSSGSPLGTSVHTITSSSETGTPGPEINMFLKTPPSSRPTEVLNSSELNDLDQTIIVTSTPVHSDPPPLRMSDMDTQSGDTFSIPSEIFRSPDIQNSQGNNRKSPQLSPSSVDMNQTMHNSGSSSDTSDSELDQALQAMKKSLAHCQKIKKRKFF